MVVVRSLAGAVPVDVAAGAEGLVDDELAGMLRNDPGDMH